MMDRRRFLLTSWAGALCVPIATEAQPHQAKPKVLFVAVSRLPKYEASFDSTLHSLGWEEGSNVLIERYYIRAEVAAWAVRRVPEVIVVPSAGIATAVRRETTSIFIVVIAAGELVGAGLAEKLARPGGNVTGTQIIQRDLMGKRLELLKELLPRLTRVAAVQEAATVPAKMRAEGRIAFEAPARALRIQSPNAPKVLFGTQQADEELMCQRPARGANLFQGPRPVSRDDASWSGLLCDLRSSLGPETPQPFLGWLAAVAEERSGACRAPEHLGVAPRAEHEPAKT